MSRIRKYKGLPSLKNVNHNFLSNLIELLAVIIVTVLTHSGLIKDVHAGVKMYIYQGQLFTLCYVIVLEN